MLKIDRGLSPAGTEFIADKEGVYLTAYRDPVGILTIGAGHTGPDVKPGMRITHARALDLLRIDAREAEDVLWRVGTAPLLSEPMEDALISFPFNVGGTAFAESTLLEKHNRRDYKGAAGEFARWVYAGGRVLPGLVIRRRQEAAMYLSDHRAPAIPKLTDAQRRLVDQAEAYLKREGVRPTADAGEELRRRFRRQIERTRALKEKRPTLQAELAERAQRLRRERDQLLKEMSDG